MYLIRHHLRTASPSTSLPLTRPPLADTTGSRSSSLERSDDRARPTAPPCASTAPPADTTTPQGSSLERPDTQDLLFAPPRAGTMQPLTDTTIPKGSSLERLSNPKIVPPRVGSPEPDPHGIPDTTVVTPPIAGVVPAAPSRVRLSFHHLVLAANGSAWVVPPPSS